MTPIVSEIIEMRAADAADRVAAERATTGRLVQEELATFAVRIDAKIDWHKTERKNLKALAAKIDLVGNDEDAPLEAVQELLAEVREAATPANGSSISFHMSASAAPAPFPAAPAPFPAQAETVFENLLASMVSSGNRSDRMVLAKQLRDRR